LQILGFWVVKTANKDRSSGKRCNRYWRGSNVLLTYADYPVCRLESLVLRCAPSATRDVANMSSSVESPILPYELLDVIAQHLIGDNAFRTCANLNGTSQAVKDVTLKTLWMHMCWTGIGDSGVISEKEIEEKWEIIKKSEGAQHIK
jgi:hypothetical protein